MRNCVLIPLVVIWTLLPAAVWSQVPPAYCTQWGSYGTGPGQFIYPEAIAVDASGNVYVADQGNNRIQKFCYATEADVPALSPFGVLALVLTVGAAALVLMKRKLRTKVV